MFAYNANLAGSILFALTFFEEEVLTGHYFLNSMERRLPFASVQKSAWSVHRF